MSGLVLGSMMGWLQYYFFEKKKEKPLAMLVLLPPPPHGFADSNPGQLYGCLRCWNRRRSIPVGDSTVALFWDEPGIKGQCGLHWAICKIIIGQDV